ncbi:MAG: ABC transporter substrate-binding protein [Bacteroidales bacterium]|nr:ABC transporter substrate-binding protein [Bacteroidales bacterium]
MFVFIQMIRSKFSLSIILLLLISQTVSGQSNKVRLQLRWYNQFQFAGYYMAKEKGFYAEHNLEVDIIPGGPETHSAMEAVLDGHAEYSITNTGIIKKRCEGMPLVALASIFQTSPMAWLVTEKSQIKTLHDLSGKNCMMLMPHYESVELISMLFREGIELSKFNLIPTSYDLKDLITGKIDAYNAYTSNEPYTLEQLGIKYRIIHPEDYGANFYSDILFTSESEIKTHPKRAKAFLEASLKGWKYALEHKEEAVQIIHEKYATQKTIEHLRWEADRIEEVIHPELVEIGHMNMGRWEFIAQLYKDLGIITEIENMDGFMYNPDYNPFDKYIEPALKLMGLLSLAFLFTASWFYWFNRKLKMEISARKDVEIRLTKANKLLKQLNEEKNDFISLLAHDLKSPLNAVKGIAELITENFIETSSTTIRDMAGHIRNNSSQMLHLINSLLNAEKIENDYLYYEPENTNVTETIAICIQNISPLAEKKHILIESKNHNENKYISGNPTWLNQVVTNLLSNAIKYSLPGGKIIVSVLTENNKTVISIKDFGVGIHKEEMCHLFKKFSKISNKPTAGEDSSGFGLYVSKKLTQKMNGRIWASSEQGKGSCFFVEFNSIIDPD